MDPVYNQPMPELQPTQHSPDRYRRPKRSLPLNLIGLVFALWTVLGWLRFVGALARRELIVSLVGPGIHAYLLLAGLAWGLLGLPVLWALTFRSHWAPLALQPAAALYPVLYWLERILLWRDPGAHRNWPLMLLLTIAWVGLVFWGLRSAQSSGFFNRKHDNTGGG